MAHVTKPIETTFEHKYARDLIRYVLRDYMTGLHWTPTPLFQETDLDSPFTPQVQAAVKEELEYDGHTLHMLFDVAFPDKSLIDEKYTEFCRAVKDKLVAKVFSIKSFMSFSICLSIFAGLSYLYGEPSGIFISYMLIIQAIGEFKNLGKIDDNIWNDMQDWLENNTEPLRMWSTIFQ